MSDFGIRSVSSSGASETIALGSTTRVKGKYDTPVKVDEKLAEALNRAGVEKPGGGEWKPGDKIYTTKQGAARLHVIKDITGPVFGTTIEVRTGRTGMVELGEPTITYPQNR